MSNSFACSEVPQGWAEIVLERTSRNVWKGLLRNSPHDLEESVWQTKTISGNIVLRISRALHHRECVRSPDIDTLGSDAQSEDIIAQDLNDIEEAKSSYIPSHEHDDLLTQLIVSRVVLQKIIHLLSDPSLQDFDDVTHSLLASPMRIASSEPRTSFHWMRGFSNMLKNREKLESMARSPHQQMGFLSNMDAIHNLASESVSRSVAELPWNLRAADIVRCELAGMRYIKNTGWSMGTGIGAHLNFRLDSHPHQLMKKYSKSENGAMEFFMMLAERREQTFVVHEHLRALQELEHPPVSSQTPYRLALEQLAEPTNGEAPTVESL